MNENYKQQIIDLIFNLVSVHLNEKKFEDATLQVFRGDELNFFIKKEKRVRQNYISSDFKNSFSISAQKAKQLFIPKETNTQSTQTEEIKKDFANRDCQTEKVDSFEKLNCCFLKNKKLAFKNHLLQIENQQKKNSQETIFLAKLTKKKQEIKIIKRNKFDNSELRMINSYCSPATSFVINSLVLIKTSKKTVHGNVKTNNYNCNIISAESRRKKATRSLGDMKHLKIYGENRSKNKKQMQETKKNYNKNTNYIDNTNYLLSDSVNNIYANTSIDRLNDSLLDNINKTNVIIENTSILNKDFNFNTSKNEIDENNSNSNNNNLSPALVMNKINILENVKTEAEEDSNKVNNNNKNYAKNDCPIKKNKVSNIKIEISSNNNTIDSAMRDKYTPKGINLYAPFSNKNSRISKKKEELKIVIENYFSINSSNKINILAVPSAIFTNKNNNNPELITGMNNNFSKNLNSAEKQPNKIIPMSPNCIDNTANNVLFLNDAESINILNSSVSTNVNNNVNNFNNLSKYLGGRQMVNNTEKVITSSILTGTNNLVFSGNTTTAANLNFNPLNYNNKNYTIETIELPEKSYQIITEINFFYRKVKYSIESGVQTDLLNVNFYLFLFS